MIRSHRLVPQLALALGTVALLAAPAAAQDHIVIAGPPEVKWQPAPPALPPGAQIAVLDGDPAGHGLVTLRLKFPANYVVPPHWHSMTEHITVISGAFYVGMGDAVDREASTMIRPGGFNTLPAKMHHYAWVRGETVVELNLVGPFDIYYVNPTDDPQKKAAGRTGK